MAPTFDAAFEGGGSGGEMHGGGGVGVPASPLAGAGFRRVHAVLQVRAVPMQMWSRHL
jgi:hypothetical protein